MIPRHRPHPLQVIAVDMPLPGAVLYRWDVSPLASPVHLSEREAQLRGHLLGSEPRRGGELGAMGRGRAKVHGAILSGHTTAPAVGCGLPQLGGNVATELSASQPILDLPYPRN